MRAISAVFWRYIVAARTRCSSDVRCEEARVKRVWRRLDRFARMSSRHPV